MSDPINHPSHYSRGQIEVIAAIESWNLNFHLGNVVKYIARADHKGNRLEDLRKAQWYLIRENESTRRQCYRQAASANASISADSACKAWGLTPRLYAVIDEAVHHGNLSRAMAALEDEIAEGSREECLREHSNPPRERCIRGLCAGYDKAWDEAREEAAGFAESIARLAKKVAEYGLAWPESER